MEVASIMQWMVNTKIFPSDIPKSMLRELCVFMENRILKRNNVLFLQEDKGDCFYIIIEGSISLYLQDSPKETLRVRLSRDSNPKDFEGTNWSSKGSGLGKKLKELPSGIAFGELGLLHDEHQFRSCSAICGSDACQLCVVDLELYNRTLRTYHQMNENKDVAYNILSESPSFKKWVPEVRQQLAEIAEKRKYRGGSYLCRKGDEVDFIFIVCEGEVAFVSEEVKKQSELCRSSSGSIVGDIEVFNGIGTYVTSSLVKSSECSFLKVPKETFLEVSEPHVNVNKNGVAKQQTAIVRKDSSLL